MAATRRALPIFAPQPLSTPLSPTAVLVYNVTIQIENDVQRDWLHWMKTHHIPRVMATGLFIDHRILQLLGHDEDGTSTFAIQYTMPGQAEYDRYQAEHAPAMQAETRERYGEKFVAFRTLLLVV